MQQLKGIIALALWCGVSVTALAANKVVKIVSHTPLSGPQSTTGETIKLGAQIAIEDFGSLLRPYGYQAVLQAEDDQANPTVGVANANRLIGDQAVAGIIGHYNSGVSMATSEVYAKANLVMISPANTNPAITERASTAKVTNRVCGRDDVQGPAAEQFMFKTLKAKKIFVINDKTAYGAGLAQEFEKAARKDGVKVLLSTGVDDKESDFSSILNRAIIQRPDVIFFGGIYPQAGLLLKQMREKHIEAALLGGDGLDSAQLQVIAGANNMRNAYFTTVALPLNQLSKAKNFINEYKTQFHKDPDGFSVASYDATHALILAIARSMKEHPGKGINRAEIAADVRKVDFEGLTGHIAFNSKGDIKTARYVVVQAGPTHDQNKTAAIITR